MADYYPLLAKAVAAQAQSDPAKRRAIYERARTALLGQLRAIQPPVPEPDIERESQALDEAINRLESELAVQANAGSAPSASGAGTSSPLGGPEAAEAAPSGQPPRRLPLRPLPPRPPLRSRLDSKPRAPEAPPEPPTPAAAEETRAATF